MIGRLLRYLRGYQAECLRCERCNLSVSQWVAVNWHHEEWAKSGAITVYHADTLTLLCVACAMKLKGQIVKAIGDLVYADNEEQEEV